MKKKIGFLICMLLCVSMTVATAIAVFAEEQPAMVFSTDNTDYTQQLGHGQSTVKAENLSNNGVKLSFDNPKGFGQCRVAHRYAVDITNLSMNVVMNNIEAGNRFSFTFGKTITAYPYSGNDGDDYEGFTFGFDVRNDDSGTEKVKPAAKSRLYFASSRKYAVAPDVENSNIDAYKGFGFINLKKGDTVKISVKLISENYVLTIANGEKNQLSLNLPKTYFSNRKLDPKKLFMIMTISDDGYTEAAPSKLVEFSINDLTENNTIAYLASSERDNMLGKLNSFKTKLKEFKKYSEYKKYLVDENINFDALREREKFEKAADVNVALDEMWTRISQSKFSETTDFTNEVNSNEKGSFAEYNSDKTQKIILHASHPSQSSIGYRAKVDISDFTMKFAMDKVTSTRFTLVLGESSETYPTSGCAETGIAITFNVENATTVSFMMANTKKYSKIDGVKTNGWSQVEKEDSSALQTIAISDGKEIVVKTKKNSDGNYNLSVGSGEGENLTQMAVVIPSKMFTAEKINPSKLFMKFIYGDQGFGGFGTEKDYEFTIKSIQQPNELKLEKAINDFDIFVNAITTSKQCNEGYDILNTIDSNSILISQAVYKIKLNSAIAKLDKTDVKIQIQAYINAINAAKNVEELDKTKVLKASINMDKLAELASSDKDELTLLLNDANKTYDKRVQEFKTNKIILIVGISIASVVVLGGAAFCVYWFIIRKKQKNQAK